MTEIDNSEDILNSRDIEDRIEELEAERGALADDLDEAEEALRDLINSDEDNAQEEAALAGAVSTARNALTAWDASDEADELKALKAFRDELEPYVPDWHHGETLIRDSYFRDYAEELADDIGAIDHNAKWPVNCIDWNKAARELQMDYTSAEFNGVTYWAR